MFFTYLFRELRRRGRQAFVIALGLALGIGLTITVTAASAGVKAAQASVLHSLYGVGTDMTVTSNATPSSAGRQNFNFSGPSAGTTTGTKSATTTTDNLNLAPGSSALTATTLADVKKVSGVSSAVGSLTLTDFNFSGTITQKVTQGTTTTTTIPGGGSGRGGGGGSGSTTTTHSGPSFGGPAGVGGSFASTLVTGVDTADLTSGPMATLTLASGSELTAAEANSYDAVVTSTYASSNSLKVGSTKSYGGKTFTIVGIVTGSTTTDVFIPLNVAQTLSSETGKVSTIYVKAGNSTEIDSVASAITKAVPTTTVTTSADLANSVTGSIKSTADLANNLGRYLSIAVLLAAFIVAALFTMSAVSRRVREFGTLKALGWTSRRVVRQVLGEAIVTGLIGGALGIGFGLAGAYAIDKFAPSLTASTSASATAPTSNAGIPGGGGGGFGGGSGRVANAATTTSVHLTAPISLSVLALAVGLAILGGLIAGGFGGWRASALRPADALRKL
jgi:putative ABC transport system permease protein